MTDGIAKQVPSFCIDDKNNAKTGALVDNMPVFFSMKWEHARHAVTGF